ncbi:MAG TPA: LacI family DNA-binding transcriptional regulator [Solirubrobacteraceae bacterium]|nr:LacI family DNA-binding transcriptional regulator [Solirubrobacteraceae bacterium]
MNDHSGTRTRATLRDVARLAGVHPATASRALNEATRSLVTATTVQRVVAAAEELAYRPNPIARGLRTSRSFTIGVVIPDLTNPLFPPIVRGIEDTLNRSGYGTLATNTDNDPARERNAIETLRAREVDGLIIATARRDDEALEELIESNVPVALVNRRLLDRRLPLAAVDDRKGIREAVAHLAELGHERIAHIGASRALSTGDQRYQGFIEAMRGMGLDPDPDLIHLGESFTEPEGARLCGALLDADRGMTAIVAGNDLIALGCYDAMDERGVACPAEISVVGFNDMPFVARFSPPMTTIRIPHYEMGVAAAELLLERIEFPDAAVREVLLEPALVVRGSTAPPPGVGLSNR